MAGGEFSDRDEGSSTLNPSRTGLAQRLKQQERLLGGAISALTALLCYHATLLPGLDLGDSASFQTGVGSLNLTPRQAYPLYYGLGNIFVWLNGGEPAYAMNLASAVYAALAVGVVTLLAAELSSSTLAGVAAGLFLAVSHTFWSQAITAEVYTLHLLMVGAALLALLEWSKKPALSRLALFYAVYALGFGNHLSMILLLPGIALFILLHRTPGRADPFQPKAIGLAVAIAALASLQYAWNFRGLWSEAEPPGSASEAFVKFWFDVTKSDWRETLVMGVSETGLQNRPAMFWFDLRQQFRVPGVLLAGLGFLYLIVRWPRRGLLLLALYVPTLAFAWTYNVGDVYIFFLPTHYILALCVGAGVATISRLPSALCPFIGALCLLYPIWHGYDTFPAMDRSRDVRAVELLDKMTAPLLPQDRFSCGDAVFGLDANWQVQNAVEYYMRQRKPGVAWFTTEELPWLRLNGPHPVPKFVHGNLNEAGRDVVITQEAAGKLEALKLVGATKSRPETVKLAFTEKVSRLPGGTIYALGLLRPYPEVPMAEAELAAAWKTLTGGSEPLPTIDDYTIIAGRVGVRPQFVKGSNRPYRATTQIGGLHFDVRMESWLPTDTIRRSGFGHVIVNRSHALTLERGLSLLALDESGVPLLIEYRAGLFEAPQRFVLGYDDVPPVPCYR